MNVDIPPRSLNHRLPAACDAPTATPASSLLSPFAISRQNNRSTSRRCVGCPGDFIGALPVNSLIHPAGLPINTTSTITVLRGPVESAQYTSFAFTQRLVDAGADPSIGSIGDGYDNAVAESTIGLFKTELINQQGPWKTIEQVEFATLQWVDWYNHERLHGSCDRLPPVEYEQTRARQTTTQ